jgi:hypothetical protein
MRFLRDAKKKPRKERTAPVIPRRTRTAIFTLSVVFGDSVGAKHTGHARLGWLVRSVSRTIANNMYQMDFIETSV